MSISLKRFQLHQVSTFIAIYYRCLCVVNSLKDAVWLWQTIPPANKFLLSERLTPYDFQRQLSEIEERLACGETCRVIATPFAEEAIYALPDTFDCVLRELCGIDKILKLKAETKIVFELQDSHDPEESEELHNEKEISRALLKKQNLDEKDMMREYFQHRFATEPTDLLDIMGSAKRYEFNSVFQKVAPIKVPAVSVIIKCEKNEKACDEWATGTYKGDFVKDMEPYTVSLSKADFSCIPEEWVIPVETDAGEIETCVLVKRKKYRSNIGLIFLPKSALTGG